jgi:predicted dinucleotide-binding enzyme
MRTRRGVGDVDDHPKIAQKGSRCEVVKAFDTTFAGTLVAAATLRTAGRVLLASDDEGAKTQHG